MLLETSLRPGTHVDLVLERDENRETVLVRDSLLHDVRGRLLLLAQVSPPLGKANVGELMELTFLARYYLEGVGPEWLRTGYFANLKEVLPNFPIRPDVLEPVLVFEAPKQLTLMTVRMHHRMVPPLDYGLMAMASLAGGPEVKASVADLSLGGAMLVHPPKWDPPNQGDLKLRLVWEGGTLEMTAKVVRRGEMDGGRGKAKGVTAVQFQFATPAQRRVLSWLLAEMERREMAKRSDWEG